MGLFSCDPNERLDPELILEFDSVQNLNDTALFLQVKFQKGDGNFGLDSWDTASAANANLFVYTFDKQENGSYEVMRRQRSDDIEIWDTIFESYHVRISSADRKPPLKGTFGIFIPRIAFETAQGRSDLGIIRYEIYAYDRDLIQSNTVFSPDISVR
ncbi:MAG: hypothetical protein FWG79_01985 [Bacteroidales bacterium]|nr:hypothetical protein [Bacteroidales bacterium]